MFQNLINLGSDKEKKKDYKHIVVLQVLIIFSALLLKDIIALSGLSVEKSYVVRDTLFLILGGIYVIILWDLLRNFIKKKVFIFSMLFLILSTYLLTLVTVNPVYKMFETEVEQQPYLFVIHFVLFSVEAIVIYYSILDIFSDSILSEQKLWGSACIFLMIGLSFGSIYDLINIVNPGSMGIPLRLGLESYTACIFYSMNMIGGHDAYQDATPLIQNIGVIESVWCNLFIVLLVGRLLSQPAAESK